MPENRGGFRPEHWIVAVLLFAMAAIAFANVVSRYVIHFSFAATEEITINIFVWLTVVGTGIAFERGGQLGMVSLYNLFPLRLKRYVVVLSASLSSILFVLVDIFMVQAIYEELTLFKAISPGLGIPVWIYYVGVPVFSVFVFAGIYRDAAAKLGDLRKAEGS